MWDSSMYGDRTGSGGFLKARRLQNVVPVVVRQIKDCLDDEFTLFGMQTQILSFVGVVLDYEVQSTKAMYNIQDHTGVIKAIWWLETDKGAVCTNLAATTRTITFESESLAHSSFF